MPDTPVAGTPGIYSENQRPLEASTSGVAWPAIIGGAFVAAALSLILMALGAGLGLASVSPWSNSGASVTTFTVMTAIWLIVIQWLASGLGGYVTGRLRTKWVGLDTHEVFFHDTANGFLTWATASVIGAVFLASAASSVIGGTAAMFAGVATGAGTGASQGAAQSATRPVGVIADPTAYFVDRLYRSDHPNANASAGGVPGDLHGLVDVGRGVHRLRSSSPGWSTAGRVLNSSGALYLATMPCPNLVPLPTDCAEARRLSPPLGSPAID